MTTTLIVIAVLQAIATIYLFVGVRAHNSRLEWVEERAHKSHSYGQAVWEQDRPRRVRR